MNIGCFGWIDPSNGNYLKKTTTYGFDGNQFLNGCNLTFQNTLRS
jgi:hypothetical protein